MKTFDLTKGHSLAYKKLKKGLKTPEDKFKILLLEVLIELGGKGKMKEALEKIEEKMKNKLKPYDMEGLSLKPLQKRWKNTVQWCRNTMVKEKLLLQDSPKGIWEISPEGKKYLKKIQTKLKKYLFI